MSRKLRRGELCDCSRRARFIVAGEAICPRCRQMETAAANKNHRRSHAGEADDSQAHLSDANIFRRPADDPFVSWILETPGQFVVKGYGTYRLVFR